MGPANLVTPKWDIYMRKWRSGVHSTAHQSTPEHTHWFDQIDMYANVCRTHCHMEDKTHSERRSGRAGRAHNTIRTKSTTTIDVYGREWDTSTCARHRHSVFLHFQWAFHIYEHIYIPVATFKSHNWRDWYQVTVHLGPFCTKGHCFLSRYGVVVAGWWLGGRWCFVRCPSVRLLLWLVEIGSVGQTAVTTLCCSNWHILYRNQTPQSTMRYTEYTYVCVCACVYIITMWNIGNENACVHYQISSPPPLTCSAYSSHIAYSHIYCVHNVVEQWMVCVCVCVLVARTSYSRNIAHMICLRERVCMFLFFLFSLLVFLPSLSILMPISCSPEKFLMPQCTMFIYSTYQANCGQRTLCVCSIQTLLQVSHV